MRKDVFKFEKALVPPLNEAALDQAVAFAHGAFGCSKWVTLRVGEQKPYYFNLDKAYSLADRSAVAGFHDLFAAYIKSVRDAYPRVDEQNAPVLAFVWPNGGPGGIAQTRGALVDRLGWQSVLVFPDRRLLRSRLIAGQPFDKYPDALRWLVGRAVIILADAATTGESLARAAGTVRAFGAEPIVAVSIYNRDEGAGESLARMGLPLHSLLSPDDVVERLTDPKTRDAIRRSAGKVIRDLSVDAASSG